MCLCFVIVFLSYWIYFCYKIRIAVPKSRFLGGCLIFILKFLTKIALLEGYPLDLPIFFFARITLKLLIENLIPSSVSIKFRFRFEVVKIFSDDSLIVYEFLFFTVSVFRKLLKFSITKKRNHYFFSVFGLQSFKSNKSKLHLSSIQNVSGLLVA